jgi:hypothetical protein
MGSVILWLRSVNLPFLPVPGWFNEEDRTGRRSEWKPSASATFLFFRAARAEGKIKAYLLPASLDALEQRLAVPEEGLRELDLAGGRRFGFRDDELSGGQGRNGGSDVLGGKEDAREGEDDAVDERKGRKRYEMSGLSSMQEGLGRRGRTRHEPLSATR